MAGPAPDALEPEVLYCVNHPKTETLIRCSKCLDPICVKCAVRTPVGLRCKKCAHPSRSPLYKINVAEGFLAGLVALVLGTLAGMLVTRLGLLFTFFLSAPVGGLIAEAVARVLHGRRGRALVIVIGAAILIGAMMGPWLGAAIAAGSLSVIPRNPLALLASLIRISTILYVVLAIGAVIARLR